METITTKRHPRRSDEEWIRLIQECRTSGLSDKQWCDEHNIATSKFYYHIRRLTQKACGCDIPPNTRVSVQEKQEVVPLKFREDPVIPTESVGKTDTDYVQEPAIRLCIHNIQMDIYNNADKDIILHTLDALRSIC